MNRPQMLDWILDVSTNSGIINIPGAKTVYELIENLMLPEYKTYPSTHEPEVAAAFSRLCSRGDTVIEIGGFHGAHSINLSNAVGTSGRVIVFEPHPQHANLIEDRIRERNISNVIIEEKAASDRTDEILLWVDDDDSSTSSTAVSHENGEYYNVESISICEYINEELSGVVDLCKIDIEGGEYELIMNSTLLSNAKILVCEIHPQFIGKNKALELMSKLRNEGTVYNISGDRKTSNEISKHSTEHIIWEQNVDSESSKENC